MTKAKFTLPNGTIINIDGTVTDIQKLVEFCGVSSSKSKMSDTKSKGQYQKQSSNVPHQKNHIIQIVNLIKECEESEDIEQNVLDKASEVNRVLLPLYIVHEYMENSIALQSGEISKITKELGVLVSQPNVSSALSDTASRYVIGDRPRKARQAVKYKLNRRGLKYMKEIIKDKRKE